MRRRFWLSGDRIPPARAAYQAICTDYDRVGPGTCLDGTMWQHAATDVGKTNPYAGGIEVGLHGPDLANHYFDIKPDKAYKRIYSGTGLMRKLFFLIHTLPDPAPYEQTPRARVRPLVAVNVGDAPHILEDHGGSWDAQEILSPSLQNTLTTAAQQEGYVFARPAEPYHLGGNLHRQVAGVIVGPSGNEILDVIVEDAGTLKRGSELAGETHSSAPGPRERADWITVFSRAMGGVFVLGGTDPATAAPLGDVALYRFGVGWTGFGEFLIHPIAATFSPSDGKLWVLDDWGGYVVFLRVDPWTAEVDELGGWDLDRGKWNHHFLSIDADGTVLLTASSEALGRSKVARIRIDAIAGAYAAQIDGDATPVLPYVTDGPIVDKDEYGFIARDGNGAMTSILRRATLLGSPGNYPLDAMFH